jgi:hypothetical protein
MSAAQQWFGAPGLRSGCGFGALFLLLASLAFSQTAAPPAPPPPLSGGEPKAPAAAAPKAKLPPATKSCLPPTNYRVVAETKEAVTTRGSATLPARFLLAVDQDTRVLLLLFTKEKLEDIELLGYQPVLPADFPFADQLPQDQALIALRRCSCAQGWKLWIALTVGFSEAVRPKLTLSNSLFVFRESDDGNQRSRLLAETFPEGTELTVDDINTDYATEIVVQYFPKFSPPAQGAGVAPKFSSLLKMWQVDGEGLLHPVPLDNVMADIPRGATGAEMVLGDYRHSPEVLYTEQRIPAARGATVIRRSYDWDDASKRYVLRDITKTQEITIR